MDAGFPVDNNNWKIFSCPSSGPDAVIIGDTIYSVFLSGTKCYFSKTSILDGNLASISKLGPESTGGSQNYPRISHDGNSLAICWKENNFGQKLLVAFTEDITIGSPFVYDTLYDQSFYSADIALQDSTLHVVWQDISSGRVRYAAGQYGLVSGLHQETPFVSVSVFPNPAGRYIQLDNLETAGLYRIYNALGQVVQRGTLDLRIEVDALSPGAYHLIGTPLEGKAFRAAFIKK